MIDPENLRADFKTPFNKRLTELIEATDGKLRKAYEELTKSKDFDPDAPIKLVIDLPDVAPHLLTLLTFHYANKWTMEADSFAGSKGETGHRLIFTEE